jgi:hypothetical protein
MLSMLLSYYKGDINEIVFKKATKKPGKPG